jgi:hypothetical protein
MVERSSREKRSKSLLGLRSAENTGKLKSKSKEKKMRKQMTWEEAMGVWKGMPELEQLIIRKAACRQLAGFGEIGSSDINHSVYALINSGTYKDELREFGIQVA